jgi:homoserine kinase
MSGMTGGSWRERASPVASEHRLEASGAGRRWAYPTEPVTVSVPATSANLGPGFDTLGLALDLTDEVTAEITGAGYRVEVTGEGAGEVPTDERHLIVATMLTTFDRLGLTPPPGLRLTCVNRIPHARGLGSSSAAIVAGVMLARALGADALAPQTDPGASPADQAVTKAGQGATKAGQGATKAGQGANKADRGAGDADQPARKADQTEPTGGSVDDVAAADRTGAAQGGAAHEASRTGDDRLDPLKLAAELEGHPDNVAPCVLGGFVIAWTGADGAHAVRLTPAAEIRPVVYVPSVRGLTAQARAALPEKVPHTDAAFNAARVALLVHALTAAPELLLTATEDRLHQPYRAASQPQTAALVARLRSAGVPAVVSGAGPSVLAFTGSFAPDPPPAPDGWIARPLAWSPTGARMLVARHAESDPVAAGRVG